VSGLKVRGEISRQMANDGESAKSVRRVSVESKRRQSNLQVCELLCRISNGQCPYHPANTAGSNMEGYR
jgi:hypothetical protein